MPMESGTHPETAKQETSNVDEDVAGVDKVEQITKGSKSTNILIITHQLGQI